jgi:hypothetical protein
MSLLPNEPGFPSLSRCTGCGRHLHRREPAIYYDETMPPIVFGECCAETVITALFIDFARVIELDDIFPSPWIHSRDPKQRANAARKIWECYELRSEERRSMK